ncbi:MAG: hypothetical protein LC679_09030 [Intrasporangiaceae bacterium]|nr:hypothetical protein [Intrasporangiaceae bacterium]
MAPRQCPACGRFLKNDLVQSLADGDQPCPGCETTLTAAMLGAAVGDPAPAAVGAAEPAAAPKVGRADASVRPPDLAPEQVRDDGDVLAGWDVGADAAEIASWNHDRAPFPTDTVVVAAGAVLGGVLGATVVSARLKGAVIGTGLGIGVGAVVRQVWRLTD